jgi:hypothetical protein
LPVDGQRHAFRDSDRMTSTGEPMHTLCGKTLDRPAPSTDAEWLWRTCELCWNETCRIVGV